MIKLDICKARMANIVNITIKTKTKNKNKQAYTDL